MNTEGPLRSQMGRCPSLNKASRIMNTIDYSTGLCFFFPSREASDGLEGCIREFSWVFQDRIRVERVIPKFLSTFPHAWHLFEQTVELKAGWGRESKRMIALGNFAVGSRESMPSLCILEWSLLFFLQDWIKCTLGSHAQDKKRCISK